MERGVENSDIERNQVVVYNECKESERERDFFEKLGVHRRLLCPLFLLLLFHGVGVVHFVDTKERMKELMVDRFLHLQMIDVFDQ